tara:strand:- start:532 stop:789 length:258 start_codon:yes stop_codon:yes gene_type:complete
MHSLKLPHNKVARLLLNIAFIVSWYALSGVIMDFLVDITRLSNPEYKAFGVIHTVIEFLLTVIPIAIVTKFIWFKKSRITTSMDD